MAGAGSLLTLVSWPKAGAGLGASITTAVSRTSAPGERMTQEEVAAGRPTPGDIRGAGDPAASAPLNSDSFEGQWRKRKSHPKVASPINQQADQQRSKIAAMPCPPPMHIVTSA